MITQAVRKQQRKAAGLKLRAELATLTRHALETHSVACLAYAFNTKKHIIRGWSEGHIGMQLKVARLVTLVTDMREFAEMDACYFPEGGDLVRQPSGYWTR